MSVMDSDQSAEDILKRAAEVCRALRCYRVVETDTQEHFGPRTQEVEERIQVGSDSFTRRLVEGDNEPHEELILRGETYWREPTGGWVKPIVVASSGMTTWQGTDAGKMLFRIGWMAVYSRWLILATSRDCPTKREAAAC